MVERSLKILAREQKATTTTTRPLRKNNEKKKVSGRSRAEKGHGRLLLA